MFLKRFAATALAVTMAFPALAADRAMIVLDGSGSMWGQIEGKSKIEIARDVLGEVLGGVPEERELGMIVYGHRKKGDCEDIELAVPAAAGSAGAIGDFAKKISPKGKTPLSASVRMAAETLKYTEDKATVILVTDGLETCEADPCALGRELESLGVDFTAHVVGFGLTKEEGAQVACLAEETGGQYFEASDAGALSDALTETVVAVAEPAPAPAPEPEPVKEEPALENNLTITVALSEDGPDVSETNIEPYWQIFAAGPDGKATGDRIESLYDPALITNLPAGDYAIKMKFEVVEMEIPVSVTADELTEHHIVLDMGYLTVTPKRTPDATEPDAEMYVQAFSGNDIRVTGYGEKSFYLPAGEVRVLVQHAGAEVEQMVTLTAGQATAIEVVVGTGVVFPTAFYSEGGEMVETNEVYFQIFHEKQNLKGERERAEAGYGSRPLNVPAGMFVLMARMGTAEVMSEPFEVKAGQRVEPSVVLNAGVAAVTAPEAYRVQIFEAKKNIQGDRNRVEAAYGADHQWTFSAGKYVATVSYEGSETIAKAEFEVVAGERVEVTVPKP
ncbi:hypothetical protein ATO6_17570 [Oceanicola sp. 22II-s10i]|uniref:vWA domain-containing protein n=1 Tax=Oceanicola sp. 22II-s10i TaxID=1317116 RepID=UPI000B527F4C|nr:VWA domain-containing protein [Oceanicola sp. 22II-s10i]OWU83670.1 hypothetical protein ATO6_17570 [Oceanicola sp. 22II-s10i]